MRLRKLRMICLVVLTTLAILLAAGCSSLEPIGIAADLMTPDNGVQVETQIGDREASLGSNIEVESDSVGKVIGNDEVSNHAKVINQTNIPTEYLIILMLSNIIGWMMPSPQEIKRGIKDALHKDKARKE